MDVVKAQYKFLLTSWNFTVVKYFDFLFMSYNNGSSFDALL